MSLHRLALITLVVLLVAGCGAAPEVAVPATSVRPAGTITRANLGEQWPFTVEQGEVRCLNSTGTGLGEVVFIAEGTTYAINGPAKSRKIYADIATIWRDDPSYPGLKVSIGPIIDLGLKLCR